MGEVQEIRIGKGLPPLRMKRIRRRMKNIFGNWRYFQVVETVAVPQSRVPRKIKGKAYVIQRLRFEDGEEYFRLGYYIIGVKPKMRGKWVWGQYAPIGPIEDLKKIFEAAKSWF